MEDKILDENKFKIDLFGSSQITSLNLPYIGGLPLTQRVIGDLLGLLENSEMRMAIFCTGCGAGFAYAELLALYLANNAITSEEFSLMKRDEKYMVLNICPHCSSSAGAPSGPAEVTFRDFYPKV